ncbi:MAG TPA: DUF559 domain-containing protein [Leifsonia sp.]
MNSSRPGDALTRRQSAGRPRSDSPMESVLRLAIVRADLPEPEVNGELRDAEGRLVALGDLVFADRRVVVEYDGDHHRHDRSQYATDIDRLWRIEEQGWRVVRINGTHMANGAAEAVARVRSALQLDSEVPNR